MFYRVFIKFCVFSKFFLFFWTLPVLVQRWCCTCLRKLANKHSHLVRVCSRFSKKTVPANIISLLTNLANDKQAWNKQIYSNCKTSTSEWGWIYYQGRSFCCFFFIFNVASYFIHIHLSTFVTYGKNRKNTDVQIELST